ncbi:MAG: PAS domain-containing protein [Myxococcaceae bacterium]|nr:PAS domain-containing protein [Myxococcaceae bacterium]
MISSDVTPVPRRTPRPSQEPSECAEIIDALSPILVVTARDGSIVHINRAGAEAAGRPAAACLGVHLGELSPREPWPALDRLRRAGGVAKVDAEADGRVWRVSARVGACRRARSVRPRWGRCCSRPPTSRESAASRPSSLRPRGSPSWACSCRASRTRCATRCSACS